MTESRSSGSSDSISTDLIAKLFHALPDEKPQELSEIEFCVFRLFSKLSANTQNYSIVFLIFLFISFIQSFACICLVGLSYIPNMDNPDYASKLFYFFLYFRTYESQVTPIYLYILNAICLFCCILFFVMLYEMHRRTYIPPRYRTILIVVLVNIPRVLSIVLTFHSSEFIFALISNRSQDHCVQACALSIYLCVFIFMLTVCSNTMYSSIFYYSGLFSSTTSIMFTQYINLFLIFAFSAAHSILPFNDANYVVSFALIIFGIFLICMSVGNFYMVLSYSTFLITHGFMMVISGLLSAFETQGGITNISGTYFIIFILYVFVYIFTYIYLNHLSKKLSAKFLKIAKKRNFKRLGKLSDIMMLNYLYFAIHNCHPCIEDNTFLEYALKQRARPVWCMFRVYHLLGLLQKTPPGFDELKKNIRQNRQINQRHRFLLFEIEKLISYRTITQVPQEMENKMSEFEARLTQYQQLRAPFMTEIAHNNTIAFIYLNALSTMKNLMLTNYACTLVETYPNSPDVLRLYANYLSIVCQNQIGCNRWTSIADDIQKRVIQYADYTHVNTLYRHPLLQISMMKHNAVQASIPLVRPRAPSVLLFPTLHDNKANLFGTKPNNHFNDKKSFADFFTIFFAVIFGVYTFVFFLTSFILCNHTLAKSKIGIDFFNCFSSYYQSFSKSMHWPLNQIFNGTVETVDTLYYNQVHSTQYGYAWSNFDQNYTFANGKSREFKDVFQWIKSDSYMVPSYNISNHMESQLEWILSRYTNLLQQIFPFNNQYQIDAIEIPVFLATISESYSLFSSLIPRFLESYIEFNQLLPKSIEKQLLYAFIPLVVFGIIVIILPPFVLKDIKELSKYFPKSERTSDHHILHLYLKRDFTSFWQIYVSMTVSVCLIIFLTIVNSVFINLQMTRTNATLNLYSRRILTDTHQFLASFAAYTDMILTQIKRGDFQPDLDAMIKEINTCLDFLANGSYIFTLYDGFLQESYLLLVQMTYQVSPTGLRYNEEQTSEYLRIYEEELVPVLETKIGNYFTRMYTFIVQIRMQEMNVNILLVLLSIICFIVLEYFVVKLHLTVRMLIEMLSGLSESSLTLAKQSSIKKNSVLDLIARPCALIDKSTRVLATNQLWLSIYDESFDSVIGRTIGELANTQEFISYDAGEGNSLIVMSEIKEELDAKNDLKNIKRDLRLLKSVTVPKRFLDVTEGTETVDFLVVVKIALIPAEKDLSPEVWTNDVAAMETWITERCQSCSDVDILFESFREITLIFGCNDLLTPYMLVLSAINIAVDVLRWAIEWDWSSGSMFTCITMSCGSPCKFVFKHNNFTTMESYGPPFEKQMKLRESMELNSIVCCEETAFRIKSMKFGFELEESGIGAYTFYLPDTYYQPQVSQDNFYT